MRQTYEIHCQKQLQQYVVIEGILTKLNGKIQTKHYLFQKTEPFTLVISAIMAQSKDDFPLPTAPTMAVNFPTKC